MTLQATPAELVFGRNILFTRYHKANWETIYCKKQVMIKKINTAENKNQKRHEYCVGDTTLYERRLNKKLKHKQPYSGPFKISKVNPNGTVKLH